MSGCEWKEFHLSWWNESCSGFARERSAGQALGGMKKRSPLGSGEGEASLALCWHSRAQAGPGHMVSLTVWICVSSRQGLSLPWGRDHPCRGGFSAVVGMWLSNVFFPCYREERFSEDSSLLLEMAKSIYVDLLKQ